MKVLRAVIRIAREIGSESAGVLKRDVERCVERLRLAKSLGPSWSVTEATDIGKHVLIRFDREQDTQNWQMLAVCVNKSTGEVTVMAETAPNPADTVPLSLDSSAKVKFWRDSPGEPLPSPRGIQPRVRASFQVCARILSPTYWLYKLHKHF